MLKFNNITDSCRMSNIGIRQTESFPFNIINETREVTMKSCFTLIEMVIVVVIIGLLASIATPLYFRHVNSSKITTAKAQVQLFEQAVMDFRLDTGKLPTQSQGLEVLVTKDQSVKNWKGPYIKGIPLDPWQNEYVYRIPGEHGEFDILSYGADGQPGGGDDDADIGNWIIRAEKAN